MLSLINKVIAYDSNPSMHISQHSLIKEMLKRRIEQIDELKEMCLKNLDTSNPKIIGQINGMFEEIEKLRTDELTFIKKAKDSSSKIQTLIEYAEMLSKHRKIEAAQILNLTGGM